MKSYSHVFVDRNYNGVLKVRVALTKLLYNTELQRDAPA